MGKLAKILGFEDREPDPKQEDEDAPAYLHSDTKVKVEQDKRAFPLQLLRHSSGKKPTDVAESWDDAKIDPPPAGYDSWVDVYEGPRGIGYVVNYELDKAGTLYQKHINYGPEKEREQDWTEVVPLEEPKGRKQ